MAPTPYAFPQNLSSQTMLLSAIMAALTVQGPERGQSDLNGKNTDGYICSVWYVH
jgi:hypothetical protein